MKIGYARVSTLDQNLDAQLDALKIAGCEKIFTDKYTRTSLERKGLIEALAFAREGDELVITKLDRLGSGTKKLIELSQELEERGIALVSLQESIDTTTSMGRFFFTNMAALATLEVERIRERTREGLAAAAARGRKGGRPWTFDKHRFRIFDRMRLEGELSIPEIAKKLNYPAVTFYRHRRLIQLGELKLDETVTELLPVEIIERETNQKEPQDEYIRPSR